MEQEDEFYSFERLSKDPYYMPDVRSEPLLDICSISIFCDAFTKEQPYQVYGEISVHDMGGSEVWVIYDRPETYPDLVTLSNNSLTLTGPEDNIMYMRKPVLCARIYNKADDSLMVDKSIRLEMKTSLVDFELVESAILDGDGGYLSINYIAMSFGVFADVDVQLVRKEVDGPGSRNPIEKNDVGSGLDVYGSIYAHFDQTYSRNVSAAQKKYFQSKLFHKQSSESERVNYGSLVTLARYSLAVPTYSDLVIDVNLLDRNTGKQIAHGILKFSTDQNTSENAIIEGGDFEDVYVLVKATWVEPFDLLDPTTSQKARNVPRNDLAPIVGMKLLQVLSVFIGHKDDNPTNIYGRIRILGPMLPSHDYFARDKKEPEMLTGRGQLLPLTRPTYLLEFNHAFFVEVALRNLEGNLIIKGNIVAPVGMSTGKLEWYDRRFCSVIRGQNAFVAVHYMVFRQAIMAEVNVQVFCAGSGPVCIHGDIVASYSSHVYKTDHEKECHRSWLFRQPESNGVQVAKSCFLPSYFIPVPVDSSLILDVNINACSDTIASHDNLCAKLDFPIDRVKRCEKVQGGSHAVLVSVRWYLRTFNQ